VHANIPHDIQQFIQRHLPAMEDVDALIALARVAPEPCSAADVSAGSQIALPVALRALNRLVDEGLATRSVAPDGGPRFTLRLDSPAEMATVRGLVELYTSKPVSLIRFVYERPNDPAQLFADAFRLRKRE
jgi:hypothetical protein